MNDKEYKDLLLSSLYESDVDFSKEFMKRSALNNTKIVRILSYAAAFILCAGIVTYFAVFENYSKNDTLMPQNASEYNDRKDGENLQSNGCESEDNELSGTIQSVYSLAPGMESTDTSGGKKSSRDPNCANNAPNPATIEMLDGNIVVDFVNDDFVITAKSGENFKMLTDGETPSALQMLCEIFSGKEAKEQEATDTFANCIKISSKDSSGGDYAIEFSEDGNVAIYCDSYLLCTSNVSQTELESLNSLIAVSD